MLTDAANMYGIMKKGTPSPECTADFRNEGVPVLQCCFLFENMNGYFTVI